MPLLFYHQTLNKAGYKTVYECSTVATDQYICIEDFLDVHSGNSSYLSGVGNEGLFSFVLPKFFALTMYHFCNDEMKQ